MLNEKEEKETHSFDILGRQYFQSRKIVRDAFSDLPNKVLSNIVDDSLHKLIQNIRNEIEQEFVETCMSLLTDSMRDAIKDNVYKILMGDEYVCQHFLFQNEEKGRKLRKSLWDEFHKEIGDLRILDTKYDDDLPF